MERAITQSVVSKMKVEISRCLNSGIGFNVAKGATQTVAGSRESPQPLIFKILSLAVQSLKNARVFSPWSVITVSASLSATEQDCSITPSSSVMLLGVSTSTPISDEYPAATRNKSSQLLVLKNKSGIELNFGLPKLEYSNTSELGETCLYLARIRLNAMRRSTNRRRGFSCVKDSARAISSSERNSLQLEQSLPGRCTRHRSIDSQSALASLEEAMVENGVKILSSLISTWCQV